MSRADPGDEVYFYHRGVPKVGKVLCTGRHGCTVEHEGERHKLKWHQLSGHKSRTPQHYRVVDQGDDGVIVENQHGRRRLLSIPAEARAEALKLTPQQISGVHKP